MVFLIRGMRVGLVLIWKLIIVKVFILVMDLIIVWLKWMVIVVRLWLWSKVLRF